MRILRFIAGFLLGYAVVVLTTEFGFRLLPKHALHSGDPLLMGGAALVAVVAGLGGGALATWIARTKIAGALVLLPLVAETIWLLFWRPSDWLDAVAAITLLAAVAAGAYFPKTTAPPTTV
jgi:DNA-binding transcriptional LysR family regulator